MYDLYCGNKNYSSWSLRAWLLLQHFGIPFREHMVSVAGRGAHADHRSYSDNGLVPCLHDDGFRVWETIAIAEYLAERHPGIWPADPQARARARSVAAEMHAGFGNLRSAMPMNVKLRVKGKPAAPAVQADIDRIAALWIATRQEFASGDGPWLFGDFSAADAMYAPVVWRFHSYNVPLPPAAAAYRDAMLAHPPMRQWEQEALAEEVALPQYDGIAGEYGGVR